MSTPLDSAGWHPDPTGRYEYRYFNGQQWTADVSLHGERFIDSGGPPAWQTDWGGGTPGTPRRTRGMAIAAFVVGLISLALAWVPFVFVLAGAGAIAAIVFGFVGVRASSRSEGYGRAYALTGIALAVAALMMCAVGFLFTRAVLREVNAYLDPGPNEVAITKCVMAQTTGLKMEGTIRNADSKPHRYEITAQYRFASGSNRTEVIQVPSVAPGDTVTFTSKVTVVRAGSVLCGIVSVYGPPPFNVASP